MENEIFNKFTKHLKDALKIAGWVAKKQNTKTVEPIHLLDGILQNPGSLAAELLHKNGLKNKAEKLNINDRNQIITLELSPVAKKIITKMINIAFEYGHLYVGTEHLLMALLSIPDKKIEEFFKTADIRQIKIKNHLQVVLNSTSHFSDLSDVFSDMLSASNMQPDMRIAPMDHPHHSTNDSFLELFTANLTDKAIQNNIDPVIGRDKEISRIIQILSRRHKNNPLLLGDPGVGKTAIIEGLAKKIIEGDVPAILKNKKILNLDIGLMVAGTMYRGEFESRLKNLLDEIKNNPDVIIFIDELHNIIGAGSTTAGTMDTANLIKPALARGEIRCIGATTQNEFHKHIESDPALERRFQPIQIAEPSAQETLEILMGLKKYYESFHQVKIDNKALRAAVDLSIKYIPDQFLPDKAIDLIDEAASRVKVNAKPNPLALQISSLQQDITKITSNKHQAISEEKYDEAITLKNQEIKLKNKLKIIQNKLDQDSQPKHTISDKQITEIVSQITNIPLAYLTETGDNKIIHLEKNLNEKIIGQTEAINDISSILKRAQIGLNKNNKPIGSFLFLGPSGVGKTELAKIVSKEYFGSDDAIIRIDMSEFTESFNISKLIGAPAGYVGYKEGGKITDTVRRKPYTVILFDEIEKAHPDVFNLLLQILDEGYLTDAEGRKINFNHALIILTSNFASEQFNQQTTFGFGEESNKNKNLFSQIKNQVLAELEDNFKPELLNRLDKIIVFNPLSIRDLKKIVKLQINELNDRLKDKNITIIAKPSVITHLAKNNFEPNRGAREIQRNIQTLIEQPLAEILLIPRSRDDKKSTIANLSLDKGKIKISL